MTTRKKHRWNHSSYGWSQCLDCGLQRWQGPFERHYVDKAGCIYKAWPPDCKPIPPPVIGRATKYPDKPPDPSPGDFPRY